MVNTDDTRQTMTDGHKTTPRVWHKLYTGELTNYDGLDVDNLLGQYDESPAGCFREEVKNMKYTVVFESHNLTNVWGVTNT